MNTSAKEREAILVVGTTSDYIEWIRRIAPGGTIFLTDPAVRRNAWEPAPRFHEEVLCDLSDYRLAYARLQDHLEAWKCRLRGVACFDCASMELAAYVARQYRLPYPSPESIRLCRSKYLSKLRWKEHGLNCAETRRISSADEAEAFLGECGGPVVLKPLTGSGSEHVYLCRSPEECRSNYDLIFSSLQSRKADRLYSSSLRAGDFMVAEEFVDGEEYSCDFAVSGGRVRLIRLTRKIRATGRPFGTIHGYVLCSGFPDAIDREAFPETLKRSAAALQIGRGVCMLDFMVRNGEIVLLELTPRPGGDCLPQLLRTARGFDIIGFNLQFAAREEGAEPAAADIPPEYLGMRIIGREGGTVESIDVRALAADPRVLEIGLTRRPGERVAMPPQDYDSWILGYVIARLSPCRSAEDQLMELDRKIDVVMEK